MKNQNLIKHAILLLVATFATFYVAQPSTAHAQGTVFTYQGRLNDGGQPANGTNYGMVFYLYDAPTNGNQLGNLGIASVTVSNGLFTVPLSFGSVFDGTPRWLEISVQKNGGSFTTLAPRQQIMPTPYAMFANTASNLSGSISSANLAGNYTNAVTFNNGSDAFNGTFSGEFFGPLFIGGSFSGAHFGDGSGLFNLNASLLSSGVVPDARLAGNVARTNQVWLLSGNTGTAPGVNFVGTTDNQPLELHVNGQRALRLVPDTSTNTSPDIIGGSPVNTVAPGLVGATIGGGGATIYAGLPGTNVILGDFNTIAGGWGNTTGNTNFDVSEATVAGGAQNTASGISSFIGGGAFNVANNNNAVVAGGLRNSAAYHAFVGSGFQNSASGTEAAISGGRLNTNSGSEAVIGGGENNFVGGEADHAVIGGGGNNSIVGSDALPVYCTIGGGQNNFIQTNAIYATVGGGLANEIQPAAQYATIGGGNGNTNGGNYATIGGGNANTNGGNYATIGGGDQNTASGNYATVGGGLDDAAGNVGATVSGGVQNTATGIYSTVPGGENNYASGQYSLAAGDNAEAIDNNSFVWGDGSRQAISQGVNTFTALATGGFWIFSGPYPAGVKLPANGSAWVSISDRNAKKNLRPVDCRAVLDKLAKVPVEQWNYKWEQDGDVPNIGPMAQDFIAAFYPGRDDKGISTLEFDGVELAAIQGLSQKLNEKDAEIQKLKQSVAQLQALVAQITKSREK